jgi:hypothetical protein
VTVAQKQLRERVSEIAGVPASYCGQLFRRPHDGRVRWLFSGWDGWLTPREFLNYPAKAFQGFKLDRLPRSHVWRPLALALLKEVQQ